MLKMVAHQSASRRVTPWVVILLLAIHAGLLAHAATRHSPTMLEPASLVAGLSHWQMGRFELFRVNPPLVRMVAALPVMVAGYKEDWSLFDDSPSARPEFQLGANFVAANGERSVWLFTIARWACIPFSLIGGLFCFLWSRELWRDDLAGVISLFLWTFEPNILAHGELITSDCAAASMGLGACYLFWRWLKHCTWSRAACAGLLLGLAELTKTSWVILLVLWPMFGLLWLITDRCNRSRKRVSGDARFSTLLLQFVCIFVAAFYLLNVAYGFDGSFTKLGHFRFVSKSMTGLTKAGALGNRFAESWTGQLPMPAPAQYIRGIDLQKKDLEDYDQRSYLRGEWKHGGWWYYYVYCLAVKTPHGTQLLFLIALFTLVVLKSRWGRARLTCDVQPRDLFVLLAPALTLLILVSSQLEFNHHFRYLLPSFGFLFVFCGANALWFHTRRRA